MSRAQEGTHQTLKKNFARSVSSLHSRMRQLSGVGKRTSPHKDKIVLLRSVTSCRATCSPLKPRPCTPRPHVHRECVPRVVCVMLSFSGFFTMRCNCVRHPAFNSMPLSAELLATLEDAILTLKKIPLARHLVPTRNGWMALTQDGLTSKENRHARVPKMKFERGELCCVRRNNVRPFTI